MNTERPDTEFYVPQRSMKKRRWLPWVLGVLSLVAVVAAIPGYLMVSGTPIIDEWQCDRSIVKAGDPCAVQDNLPVPANAASDPYALNRPWNCTVRWGWVELEPTRDDLVPADKQPEIPGEKALVCWPSGKAVPSGFTVVSEWSPFGVFTRIP